jgi:glyceraldehyde 3-phosphate dehydrogenase
LKKPSNLAKAFFYAMKKIGINGFGRIGRITARLISQDPNLELVAVNDLHDTRTMGHLFKYDSVHGRFNGDLEIKDDSLVINGKEVAFYSTRDPENIPWNDHGVDVVIECTGIFRNREGAEKHLKGGAKKVIISAPARDENIKTVVVGVNDHILDGTEAIISNASCTTNCAAPMVKVVNSLCDIESCYITTVHSYTGDQRLHDAPHKDLRRARAAAESIVPTTTGAAKAISKIFPDLHSTMGGCGIRVPVADGSLTDITCVVRKPITTEEINNAFLQASLGEFKGILDYTEDPIVSVDIVGHPASCIFDSLLTSVIGNMVKVVGWYDNEMGYSNRIVDLIHRLK